MKNNEQILIEALELYDRGRKPSEILAMFPEAQAEIKELFETTETLHKTRGSIKPEPHLLRSVLEKIESRAAPSANGASLAPQNAGREEQIFMAHRRRFHFWQVAVPVGALALLLIIFLSSLSGSPTVSQLSESPFELSTIRKEADAADFTPELYDFLEQEDELKEIDAALANF